MKEKTKTKYQVFKAWRKYWHGVVDAIATIPALGMAIGSGFVGGVAIAITFPAWGIPIAVFCGFAGIFSQYSVYKDGASGGMSDLFIKGYFKDIRYAALRNFVLDSIEREKNDPQIHSGLEDEIYDLWLENKKKKPEGKSERKKKALFRKQRDQFLDTLIIKHSIDKNALSNISSLASLLEGADKLRPFKFRVLRMYFYAVLGFIASVLNAICLGAVVYVHVQTAFTSFLVLKFGGAALAPVFLTTTVMPFLTVFLVASSVIASFLLCLWMCKTMIQESFIVKTFRSIRDLLVPDIDPKSKIPKGLQWVGYGLKCIIVIGGFIAIIIAAILVSLASSGAFISATNSMLTACTGAFAVISAKTLEMISIIVVLSTVASTNILYISKFAWEAFCKIGNLLVGFFELVKNPTETWGRFCAWCAKRNKNGLLPVKVVFWAIGFVVAVGLLITHSICEAAFAKEGVTSTTERFEDVFVKISGFIDTVFSLTIPAALWAWIVTFTTETFSDLPFVIKTGSDDHGHEHGDLSGAMVKFVDWLYKLFNTRTVMVTGPDDHGFYPSPLGSTPGPIGDSVVSMEHLETSRGHVPIQ